MISPTGHGIRGNDKHGFGLYGKPRAGKDRHGITKTHSGSDFIVFPIGQEIVAPATGLVMRIKYPYSKPVDGVMFSGIFVRANDYEYTLFYFEPLKIIIKTKIYEGQVIGHAQDISIKYSGMIPHVHFHYDSMNPELFLRLP